VDGHGQREDDRRRHHAGVPRQVGSPVDGEPLAAADGRQAAGDALPQPAQGVLGLGVQAHGPSPKRIMG
jgi:hypothetical protein